ncbi:hypothetical protein AB0941_26135 [Streptomyces sp. NPDC013433]|uniref:hypothetical protein n=1 Tax=Streptomyces sp. NPDC013433 TaxID=3155604 RepID=UPI003453D7BD
MVEDQPLGQFDQGVAGRVRGRGAQVAHGPLDHAGVCHEDLRRGRGGLAGAWFSGDQGPQSVAGEDEDAVAALGCGVEVVLRHDVVHEAGAGRDVGVTASVVRVPQGRRTAQPDAQPDVVVLVRTDRLGVHG